MVINISNIERWTPYSVFSDKEDIDKQKKQFNITSLKNDFNKPNICFVCTKYIQKLNDYIESLSSKIKIKDTTSVIEDEVYYTCKIEGAKTTRIRTTEIHNGANINKDNEYSERMIKNSFEATKLLNIYGQNLSLDKIVKVWNVLTHKCLENSDIKGDYFRNGNVEVGNFIPPDHKQVYDLMDIFINFYNSKELDEYPFIKASILHFAFETIHPFCDGNGRMGRLLLNNYLINQGIESAKAVSFSMEIDKRRSHYDVAFVDSENIYNDCTPIITYLLENIAYAYEKAYELCKNEIDISNDTKDDIKVL